jgi:uncharacterized protein (DUF779 family)
MEPSVPLELAKHTLLLFGSILAVGTISGLLARLVQGPVMFFQSGGCCENTAPQCFPLGKVTLSPNDIHIGDMCSAGY